jgi:glutamate N-acetyltransferase/amino-acid N-acetyltransferase
MAAVAAEAVGCRAEQMLVCSTGVIGRHLPMPEVEAGIRAAAPLLRGTPDALERAARAILTTDTKVKVSQRSLDVGGTQVRVLGFAKGAAMIGPNLATMLGFVLTDAGVTPDVLTSLGRQAADRTFNCVSVEGHTSTNDTVLFFANGTGPALHGEAFARFSTAVTDVCGDLARAIAADAEGAAHLITIDVEGLRTEADARRVAKAVAESALVKTAVFGADPNWGRFVSAAGYSGVEFAEEQLSLSMGDVLLYENGSPLPFDAAAASAYLRDNREVRLRLVFSLGSGRCTYYTCDLTYDYVRLNADYTT